MCCPLGSPRIVVFQYIIFWQKYKAHAHINILNAPQRYDNDSMFKKKKALVEKPPAVSAGEAFFVMATQPGLPNWDYRGGLLDLGG